MQSLRAQGRVIPFGVIKEQHTSGSQRTVDVALRQTLWGGHYLVLCQLPSGFSPLMTGSAPLRRAWCPICMPRSPNLRSFPIQPLVSDQLNTHMEFALIPSALFLPLFLLSRMNFFSLLANGMKMSCS